jgi:hypothetical protein
MSGLLALARDYIERMANPVYGFSTNEEYSQRFGELVETEGFDQSLRGEVETLRDTDTLTSNGWLWLLGWARSRRIRLNEDLLLTLFEQWASVPARCAIIELATMGVERDLWTSFSIQEFPDSFLAQLLRRSVAINGNNLGEMPTRAPSLPTAHAENLLIVLMQVGTPLTVAAASALLRHQWRGHEALFNFALVLADSVDTETRRVWSDQLRVDLFRTGEERP